MSSDIHIGEFKWNPPSMEGREEPGWHEPIRASHPQSPICTGQENWVSFRSGTLRKLFGPNYPFNDIYEDQLPDTGLYEFLEEFDEEQTKPITQSHLEKVRELKQRFEQKYPDVPEWEDADEKPLLSIAKRFFEWLEFWIEYSLENCKNPMLSWS